jgi:hypothetical protein
MCWEMYNLKMHTHKIMVQEKNTLLSTQMKKNAISPIDKVINT